jgi:hypothetical protein
VDLHIWYATETLFHSWGNKSLLVTRGLLVLGDEGIQFIGPNGWGFEMRRIRAVRWMVPWTTIVVLAICDALFLLLVLATASRGSFLGCAVVSFLPLQIGNLAALSSPDMSWVRVDYLDERSQPYRAYFTVGSLMERWTGGGWRLDALFRQLAEQSDIVIPPVQAAKADAPSDRPPDTRLTNHEAVPVLVDRWLNGG